MTRSMDIEICQSIEASIAVKRDILGNPQIIAQIGVLATQCLSSLKKGGKIIFAGNGGSFADAQHLSAEFTSRFIFDRSPLASIALGTNNSALSAIGNDYGYDQVFARELEAIARPEDIFIPITTSGNSRNILMAVGVAKLKNVPVLGLTGLAGGKLIHQCKCICIPSTDTARIQECHIMIGHIVCGIVERCQFPKVREENVGEE